MVEQRPFKPLVGGSSPPAPTKNFKKYLHFSKSTPLLSAFHTHESHKYSQVGHSKILAVTFRGSHIQWICRYSRRLSVLGRVF